MNYKAHLWFFLEHSRDSRKHFHKELPETLRKAQGNARNPNIPASTAIISEPTMANSSLGCIYSVWTASRLQSGRAWTPFLSALGLCSQGRHHLPQTSVTKYLRTRFPPQPILKTPESQTSKRPPPQPWFPLTNTFLR